MKKLKLFVWLKANRIRLAIVTVVMAIAAIALQLAVDRVCGRAAEGRMYLSLATVPEREVGLVLGSSKQIRGGRPNPHFYHRIEAAAALYRAGKVHHLLVSGDNHIASYDEPDDMRAALIAAGVPASAITCDYAGFHTLDSVVRAKEVFGLTQFTIISEEYHCPRALWIAQTHGVDAVAYGAPDVGLRGWAWRANAREQLARTWCAVDLYLLHRGPKFLGPKEPILGARQFLITVCNDLKDQGRANTRSLSPQWGEIPPKNSRIEPMNLGRSSTVKSPRRGNNFSLSLGERAGVRAGVKPFLTTSLTRFCTWDLTCQVHGKGQGEGWLNPKASPDCTPLERLHPSRSIPFNEPEDGGTKHLTPALSPFGPSAPTKRGEGETRPASDVFVRWAVHGFNTRIYSRKSLSVEGRGKSALIPLEYPSALLAFSSTDTGSPIIFSMVGLQTV